MGYNTEPQPTSPDEYMQRSTAMNVLELIWEVGYDANSTLLIPRCPLLAFNRNIKLTNRESFMEVGTKHGWKYWQSELRRRNRTVDGPSRSPSFESQAGASN